jgi:acetyl esterase/lipase
MVGITYSSADPPTDAKTLLQFVRAHAAELGVDPERIGIFAASGNGPTALSLLMGADTGVRFAVMCNTYMLDVAGTDTIAEMSAQLGFAAPNVGKSVSDLDSNVPIFVVRSGEDQVPGLNDSIERFIASAIESNRRIRFINLPSAHTVSTRFMTQTNRVKRSGRFSIS